MNTDHQLLTELANKLFMYTDMQLWDKLLSDVFTEEIWFDMSSAGAGEPGPMKAALLCQSWKEGFTGLDSVHHQAGHYLIEMNENSSADIFAYAVAYHYKKAATKGQTRTFVGSYDLKAIQTSNGWRLSQFKYNLKFIDGNASLE